MKKKTKKNVTEQNLRCSRQWSGHTGLFLSGIFRYATDYEDKQALESLSDLEKFQHESDFSLNTIYSCWLV